MKSLGILLLLLVVCGCGTSNPSENLLQVHQQRLAELGDMTVPEPDSVPFENQPERTAYLEQYQQGYRSGMTGIILAPLFATALPHRNAHVQGWYDGQTTGLARNPRMAVAWVIGNVPPPPAMQRVSDVATGKAVLIQEQTIGRVPVVFESQSRCLREDVKPLTRIESVPSGSRLPHPLGTMTQTNLVMAKGRWISEVLPTDTYSGVKEFAGVTNVGYTYFLSEDRFSTGTFIRVAASTNSITLRLDRVTLPVPSLPLFMEVVDDIARKELGSTNGVLSSDETFTLSVPLRSLPPEGSGTVVSVHLTSSRGLSLLSGGSYLDAYFGWTNGVSRLDTLLKTEEPSVLFSIHLRLDLESGKIWD